MQETDVIEHRIPGAQCPLARLVKLLEDKILQTADNWIQCSLLSLSAVASSFKKPHFLQLKLQKWKCGNYPTDFHYGQY